jgi:CheY-like chemotaxis protein
MSGIKPQVVYFCDEQDMVDLVSLTLRDQFQVTPVAGVTSLDDALGILRQIKPDFVIVDPDLSSLNHQQLFDRIRAEAALKGIQILIVREDV